jgi:signal transduction histidine kinase
VRWYRSLYARAAVGSVAFLATMLVVQAVLFVWLVAQSGRTLPGEPPARLAMNVATDLANALDANPNVNLAQYVKDQYAQYAHPFFVMLTDGTLIMSGSRTFPEPLLRAARARIQRRGLPDLDRPEGPRPGFGRGEGPRPGFDRGEGPRPGFDRGGGRADRPDRFPRLDRDRPDFIDQGQGPGFRFVRPAPIIVKNQLAGVVVVPPNAPFGFLLNRFAPTLSIVAAGVLAVGTVLTSLLIFGPPRRRLRDLEHAARRLGSGDLTARAPAKGGDEIAAVATAFNSMADDLSRRAEALAASDRVRRQLLADVSHELTTPVTAMRGYLETLTMPELELDEATKTRYLGIIADETGRLERTIGDLLDLARLEGGGGTLKMEEVKMAPIFERVAARHERTAGEAGVAIEQIIEPGGDAVVGDRDRLEQALQNLAANALRYSPRGSAIRLRARPANGGVSISVEDAGPGIPTEHLPRVFDRFYKADASRAVDQTGGSGLGLSIVKAIVERHGGKVAVASRPGATVFTITGLPAPNPYRSASPTAPADQPPDRPA